MGKERESEERGGGGEYQHDPNSDERNNRLNDVDDHRELCEYKLHF